jgi:hypothetical protein
MSDFNIRQPVKGCLISESFTLWLKSPKKDAKNYPEYYQATKEKMLRIVLDTFSGRIEPK